MAHRINKGGLPDFAKPDGESDYYFIESEQPADVILELVRERIPKRFGLDPIPTSRFLFHEPGRAWSALFNVDCAGFELAGRR